MLIEIPDPEIILSVILAFVMGIIGLYAYFKIRPFVKTKNEKLDTTQTERLEYYERQLIDMKIRLDALELQGIDQDIDKKIEDPNLELKQFIEKLAKNDIQDKPVDIISKVETPIKKVIPISDKPNIVPINPVDYVLHLITNKAMTSRDIQITLKKSREHTSRLMKKLFEDGYVERNTDSKPYTYSISKKGIEKVERNSTDLIIE